MNKCFSLSVAMIAFWFAVSYTQAGSSSPSAASSRPNILLVVADDMGMLDAGAFGGEIRTPTIDRLAKNGLRFTDFNTSATCSPSRAMLLSGVNSHAAGLGNMAEHIAPNQLGHKGYEGYLSERVVSVASLFQDSGYRTYMAGKWHLGDQPGVMPNHRGFDESFTLLHGGSTYFNDMRPLAKNRKYIHYAHNGEVLDKLPEDFYATEYYADFILQQLQQREEDAPPFFAYLAFTAPHWPFQVKDEHINLYKGNYDQGYEAIRAERIQRAKAIGVLPMAASAAQTDAEVVPWDELEEAEKNVQAKSMEIYAALVERMDFHFGRVMDYLEERGELDNTIVVFLSDNGAAGTDFLKAPALAKWLTANWDFSYENMGRKGSYVYMSPGWAAASVGVSRRYKTYLNEGGVRSPLIISYPGIANKGGLVSDFTTVKDVAPTLLRLAEITHPGENYKGRKVTAIEGDSLLPLLTGAEKKFTRKQQSMGWELFGHRAIRHGDWKLLWLSSQSKKMQHLVDADRWELYNLAVDPAESNNLAAQEPEKLGEMVALWDAYAKQQSVIFPVRE